MNLTNGCYYKNAEGKAVKCQLHGDGYFHIFDVEGNEIEKVPVNTKYKQDKGETEGGTHVSGWRPIGRQEFLKERFDVEEAKKKKKGGKKKKYIDVGSGESGVGQEASSS